MHNLQMGIFGKYGLNAFKGKLFTFKGRRSLYVIVKLTAPSGTTRDTMIGISWSTPP